MISVKLLPIAAVAAVVSLAQAAPIVFPPKINHWKTVASYGAIPNDGIDDTKAIRACLSELRTDPFTDYYGQPRMLYFPAGTYDVSDSISWIGCSITIQGQGVGATIFKLKDACVGFDNAAKPRPVWKTIYGNMAFKQNFHDFTINTGTGNPGAIGIDYVSNNVGAIVNVEIISADRKGVTGLAMIRQWPGPSLIKNVTIDGFNTGIQLAQAEYGITFENITVRNQNTAGIDNQGNVVSMRKFVSINTVQAIKNAGHLTILDATMTGGSAGAAIMSTGDVYGRNLSFAGYSAAISSKGTLTTQSPVVEFVSSPVTTLFPSSPKRSLNLPVQETPTFFETDVNKWATFDPPTYGVNTGLPTAINSGKTTVCAPSGIYYQDPVMNIPVPAGVRRIIGFDCTVNMAGFCFQVKENSPEPLIIERFAQGVRVEHSCARTVVIKHGGYAYTAMPGAGNLFMEDVGIGEARYQPGQFVYVRQYNTESLDAARTKITNDNAKLWILGLKTEGIGPVATTINGGFTEVLGALIYPINVFTATSAPGFVNTESNVSLIFRSTSYAANHNYPTMISETRGGVTKTLSTNGGVGLTIPLYSGFDSLISIGTRHDVAPLRHPALAPSTGRFVVTNGNMPMRVTGRTYDLRGRLVRMNDNRVPVRTGVLFVGRAGR